MSANKPNNVLLKKYTVLLSANSKKIEFRNELYVQYF